MLHIETYQPELYSDLIERIWVIDNSEEINELLVPPNQYVSMVFPLGKSDYLYNNEMISQAQIEGLSLQTKYLKYRKGTKVLGIRFYPHGLSSFVKISGQSCINKSIELLPHLNQETKGFVNKLATKLTNEEVLKEVYAILKILFNKKNHIETVALRDYYQYFRGDKIAISIEEYCRLNKTNYTTLNRRFHKIIGMSPKQFQRLIKFRKSLCRIIDSPDSMTKIGMDAGYFDQAHFIREFKVFLNQSPHHYKTLLKSADKESKIINYNFTLY